MFLHIAFEPDHSNLRKVFDDHAQVSVHEVLGQIGDTPKMYKIMIMDIWYRWGNHICK